MPNNLNVIKGNDGRRRHLRRRCLIRVVISLALFLVTWHLLWTYWLAGVFVPDYVIDKETGRKKYRRHPELLTKTDITTGKAVPTDAFDGIMEGYLTLISIQLPRTGGLVQSEDSGGGGYRGVTGTFCHIAWMLQETDPSKVPMFRDLQQQSPLCQGTMVKDIDLYDVAQKARQYDTHTHNFTATQAKASHVAVPPTAVVFHETRCGSTLVSNLLVASQPAHVRSYAEAPPPLTALAACDVLDAQGQYCDPEAQLPLVRDVFYLLGRVTRPQTPQHVFYKLQSISVHHIAIFRQAMPRTPWAFVYRNSVEILMSHLKHYQVGVHGHSVVDTSRKRPVVCLRNYGKARQPPLLLQVAAQAGRNVTTLTQDEYCAAHLASLVTAALQEYQSQQKHLPKYQRTAWFLNYDELPHAVWEQWLPRLHVGYIDSDMKDRMQQVANVYSKAGAKKRKQPTGSDPNNNNAAELWKEDSTMKQARAPDSVKAAAKLFLDPLFDQMQQISKHQK